MLIWSFNFYNSISDRRDPLTTTFFMMDNGLPVFIILVAYWLFVSKLGPRHMKNRRPYNLKNVILVYNLAQIFLNLYLTVQLISIFPTKKFICIDLEEGITSETKESARLQHVYVMLKIFDLLDTIFFVLRKKQSQITFLHVYHHIMMVVACWTFTWFFRFGQGYYMTLINSFVHAVMYFYYLLTSLGSVKTMWWKKHLTQLQMVQHFFVGLSFAASLVHTNCNFPKYLSVIGISQSMTIMLLFWNFYKNAYRKVVKHT